MKLLKLSEEHYILADKLDINVGDWITDTYLMYQCKDNRSLLGMRKVTHSTQPLCIIHGDNNKETISYGSTGYLPISEVKKLLGEVDVKKKAHLAAQKRYRLERILLEQINEYGGEVKEFVRNFIVTYNQVLEDNKEKKYTEENIRAVFMHGFLLGVDRGEYSIDMENKSLSKYLQPATEWDVEIIDGKLKLK